MHPSNRIIHGLWIGEKLSPLELLTLHSFVEKGHEFHLWLYGRLQNDLPKGVVCQDANTILPEAEIFIRQKGDSLWKGFGKGSLALFSDLFRFKLLYEKGGWWVDMDVTCLKALDIETPYYFRAHPVLPMIGNVIKCPAKSPLMLATYTAAKQQCDAQTEDWLLSNKILNQNVSNFGLSQYIQHQVSNEDDWLEIERLLYARQAPKEHWKFIHWMNEEWRGRDLDKNTYFKGSFMEQLFHRYELDGKPVNPRLKNRGIYYLREIQRFGQLSFRKVFPKKNEL